MEIRAIRALPGTLFGLTLAAMGLAATAENLQLWAISANLLDFLPFFFLSAALDRAVARRYGAATLLCLAGILVAWTRLNPGFRWAQLEPLWPLGLVLLGILLVTRAFREPRRPAPGESGGDLAFLSSVRSVLVDETYRGGSLIATLGVHHLDLRRAHLAEEGAVLYVFAYCGGIEITVPEGWQVQLHAHTLLGGGEDKTDSHRHGRLRIAGTPTLVVQGWVLLGGIEIHT